MTSIYGRMKRRFSRLLGQNYTTIRELEANRAARAQCEVNVNVGPRFGAHTGKLF